jgi:poly-gamma-glutamate capsule biosynthesis protein CapA/YwtB (metallophosphatase superfamily)
MYTNRRKTSSNKKTTIKLVLLVVLISVLSFVVYYLFFKSLSVQQRIDKYLIYDQSITAGEKTNLEEYITQQEIKLESTLEITSVISEKIENEKNVTNAFVPVTDAYSVKQKVTKLELQEDTVVYDENISNESKLLIEEFLGNNSSDENLINLDEDTIKEEEIVITSYTSLNPKIKLLSLEDNYFLDTTTSGAMFREIKLEGDDVDKFAEYAFGDLTNKDQIYKTNITGVTALTRVMIRKLAEVGNPTYFSEKIGDFLADADLTHVSNEVSFKPDCTFAESSVLLFCSPLEFIETLKASGVDLVELTGNHNNDFGSRYNKETIELYRSLGWGTVGGGLNNEDASKVHLTDAKGTKLAFLAYNYPDSPNGVAISGVDSAGANSFDFTKIEADILVAKQEADFVTVNVQYWECYSYPDGYVEFPQCDVPIGEQEENFKRIIDLGADMVVGSSAHQPQTWEFYNGKPIYYGLGNLYFDQTSWPGTERGLVLSNYFIEGKLIQTKITPTVYGDDLQTRVMTDEEADYLLTRLQQARN